MGRLIPSLVDIRCGLVFLLKLGLNAVGPVATAEGLNMVLEGSLVLEVGATKTVPNLAAVLLVGPPIALNGEGLAAFPAHEGLRAVLAFVVSLEGSEVLEGPCPRVVDVVLAPRRTAVARQPQHRCRLRPPEGLWPLSVLRSMPPHMHLEIIVSVESLATKVTRKLSRSNEDLRRGRNPVLPHVQAVQGQAREDIGGAVLIRRRFRQNLGAQIGIRAREANL